MLGVALAIVAVVVPRRGWAHEAGAPFSGAVPDLLARHHAHVKNEQRLNLTPLIAQPAAAKDLAAAFARAA